MAQLPDIPRPGIVLEPRLGGVLQLFRRDAMDRRVMLEQGLGERQDIGTRSRKGGSARTTTANR